jgi:NADP-dependent 3-hydroxy acid dehydrogenase YdfG
MPTIAVVGAGPGLGLSLAKVFGGHGFQVALVSRRKDKLDALVAELATVGITAAAFPADTADQTALAGALEQAAAHFGGIDVLEFSPYAGLNQVFPHEVTVENLRPEIEHLLYGAVTATRTVLPSMLAAGTGTLLFTTGGGAISPYPMLATTNAAQSALRNWTHNLHNTLAGQGIYVGTVAISLFIGATPPAPGVPHADPGDIARAYWTLHTERDKPEHTIAG